MKNVQIIGEPQPVYYYRKRESRSIKAAVFSFNKFYLFTYVPLNFRNNNAVPFKADLQKKMLRTWTSMKLTATPPINYEVLLQYGTPNNVAHIVSAFPGSVSDFSKTTCIGPLPLFLHNTEVKDLHP